MSMPAGRAGHFVGLDALIKSEQGAAKGLFELSKATREAAEEVARIGARAAEPRQAVAAAVAPAKPEAQAPGGGGLDVGAISGAMRRAEAPLISFGAHIDLIFDRVAGTVIEGFRRIDSNTKFPMVDKAFKAVSNAADDAFRFLSGRAKKSRDDVGGTLESVERSIKEVARSIKEAGAGAGMAPLESTLKEVSASFGSIDGSLKQTAESLRALAPAAQPFAGIVKEIADSAGKAAEAGPLLAKDFVGVNVPGPGQRPGYRKQGMGPIKPPPDAAPAPIAPARPAPSLSGAAAGVARDASAAFRSFATQGLAATNRVAAGFRSVSDKASSLKSALDKVPFRRIVAISGSALLAGRAIGKITAATGGVSGALSALGAASVSAFGVTVTGTTLAQAAFTALSLTTGLGGLEMIALGARAALATVVVVKMARALYNVKFLGSSLGDVAGKTFSQMFRGAVSLLNPFNKLTASVGRTQSATSRVSASVKGMAGEIAMALGIVAVVNKVTTSVKDFFVSGVKGASDLAEATSAAKVTFGEFNGKVAGQAKQMARDYGLSQTAQLKVAAGFGEMAMGAGMAQGASADFANTFTKLAADLNSRMNFEGGFEEAAQKISAALAGESEPLRRLGVTIDEDAVKAKALAMGLATSTKEISNQAEMAARAALIQEGLASASGDLARTSGSAANQFRKAGGGLENFGIAIGELLLPAVTAGTSAFNDLLSAVIDVFEANRPTIEAWAGAAKGAMDRVGVAVRNLGPVWEIAKLKAVEFAANTVAAIATIPDNAVILGQYLYNNWRKLWHDMVGMVASAIANLYDNLTRLGEAVAEFFADPTKGFHFDWANQWRPMLEGFEATADKLPALLKPKLISMEAEINKQLGKIAENEAKREKPVADEAAAARKPAESLTADKKAKKKKKEDPFAELAEAGSKEAYSAIIRHGAGGKSDDGMKDTAKNTRQTAAAAKKTVKLLERLNKLNSAGGSMEIMGMA